MGRPFITVKYDKTCIDIRIFLLRSDGFSMIFPFSYRLPMIYGAMVSGAHATATAEAESHRTGDSDQIQDINEKLTFFLLPWYKPAHMLHCPWCWNIYQHSPEKSHPVWEVNIPAPWFAYGLDTLVITVLVGG